MPIDNSAPRLTVVAYQPDHVKFTLHGVDMACVPAGRHQDRDGRGAVARRDLGGERRAG